MLNGLLIKPAVRARFRLPPRLLKVFSWLCFAAGPVLSYWLVELLNYNDPWNSFPLRQIVLNLLWYYIAAFFLWLLLGRRTLSAGVAAFLFICVGVANRYAIRFRGRTIFPGDLSTLLSCIRVAGGYNYTPDDMQLGCLVALAVYLVVLLLLPRRMGRRLPPRRVWLPLTAASLLYIVVFFQTGFLSWLDIEPSMWTTRGNGLVLNYTMCLRYSRVEKPENYSEETLDGILAEFPSETASSGNLYPGVTSQTRPVNVIVVMNESFSDLSDVADLETNEDWMPFWRSLTENTVKGTAYSSVFGGTTANSEYEFLTGNTTAFLPAGTVPYQLYVKDGAPSLVAQMSALGYRTVAMHPYYSSGWNRPTVYRCFGFDETYFKDDFTDLTYLRGYASDRSDYENVIRMFEEKEAGEPLFLFNVTMQNHSSYNVAWNGLEQSVWLTGEWAGRFSTVNQYLSLMKESDSALEYLIGYFSQVEEPTMILVFGDHQPQVATNFYSEVLGGEFDTLDAATAQTRQRVPFLIWANYDLPEEDGVELSLNYLSALLVEEANLPATGYQRFLSALYEEVPVVNSVGYETADGTFTFDETSLPEDAQADLLAYQQLQYNAMFDTGNLLQDFFFLPEK